jgi:hypothetical protein
MLFAEPQSFVFGQPQTVGQTFLSAGSGDFRVAGFETPGWKAR